MIVNGRTTQNTNAKAAHFPCKIGSYELIFVLLTDPEPKKKCFLTRTKTPAPNMATNTKLYIPGHEITS